MSLAAVDKIWDFQDVSLMFLRYQLNPSLKQQRLLHQLHQQSEHAVPAYVLQHERQPNSVVRRSKHPH
jgi:hypothetical protein